MVKQLVKAAEGSPILAFDTAFPQTLWSQYIIILRKNIVSYWRCCLNFVLVHRHVTFSFINWIE